MNRYFGSVSAGSHDASVLEPNPDVFSEYGLLQNEIPQFANALVNVKLFKEDNDDRWTRDDDIVLKEKWDPNDKASLNTAGPVQNKQQTKVTDKERDDQADHWEPKPQRTKKSGN